MTNITTRKIVKLGMTGNTRERIKQTAKMLGYGPKETNKFLNKIMDVIEGVPALFKK